MCLETGSRPLKISHERQNDRLKMTENGLKTMIAIYYMGFLDCSWASLQQFWNGVMFRKFFLERKTTFSRHLFQVIGSHTKRGNRVRRKLSWTTYIIAKIVYLNGLKEKWTGLYQIQGIFQCFIRKIGFVVKSFYFSFFHYFVFM